jgi:hypothetical protein
MTQKGECGMVQRILRLALAMAALGLLADGPVGAATDPVAKCLASKQKAAGKKAQGKLGCYSTAAKTGSGVDQDCLTKADDKFTSAFGKAEANGACPGNATSVEGAIDGCTNDVVGQIPETGKCPGAKLKAAGKKASGKLKCYSKATGKGTFVDSECLMAAQTKFGTAFTNADAAGACMGDADTVEGIVDTECVSNVVSQLTIPRCGNNIVEGTETCDDGNTVDESDPSVPPNPPDNCPADCHIGTCGAGTGTNQAVSVQFAKPGGSPALGGITVFLDYPDDKTAIPGSGSGVSGSISNLPSNTLSTPNDLDYGLLEEVVSGSSITPGRLFTVTFHDCPGAPALAVADFQCVVKDATDTGGNDIAGVTCSVTIP